MQADFRRSFAGIGVAVLLWNVATVQVRYQSFKLYGLGLGVRNRVRVQCRVRVKGAHRTSSQE